MSAISITSAVLLSLMLGVAGWNVVAARRLDRMEWAQALPRVSVLVPARNEASNLGETLAALLRLNYPDLEIVVLDDDSEDDTAAVVEAHRQGAAGRLRLLSGRPLPAGWLGKSWACHQLAEAATGEILVFCDADVTAHSEAVRRTVAALSSTKAGALTALPRHRSGHWTGCAVVPLVVHLPVLALLPLPLVHRLRAPSLAMGNGQWFAFSREAYRAAGGHAAVRGAVVEDVALARRVKAAGYRLLAVVATPLLEVRMYPDATTLREGFQKNLYALAGGRPLPFAAALVVFTLTAIYPWAGAALGARGAALPLLLLLALRVCGALLFHHGLRSVLLHPIGSLLLAGIALGSYAASRRGRLRWKGRRIAQASQVALVVDERP